MPALKPHAPECEGGARRRRVRRAASRSPVPATLTREELIDAPLRWPRPSRLREPLELPGKRVAAALRALGIETVGDLLEHLPSDSREARTVAALRSGRAGDGGGRGARDRRRARCAAAACARSSRRACSTRPARCAPPSSTSRGSSSATRRAPACCCTARPTSAGASASPTTPCRTRAPMPRPRRRERTRAPARSSHYPASEGVSSTQILTLVQGARGALADVPEALAAGTRTARAAARPRRRARGDALPARAARGRGGPPPARLRGAAARAARVRCAAAPAREQRAGAPALCEAGTLSERWLAASCRSRPPATSATRWRWSTRTWPRAADAAPADGRGRQRQDGGRAVRDAARRRARRAGRADGADRDARRTALRDDAAADGRRAAARRAADRLHAGAQAARDPRASSRAASSRW